MIIHQIFIEIPEVGYTDIPSNPIWLEAFYQNVLTKRKVKVWYEKDIKKLIDEHYPQYKVFISIFPNKFWLIDFARCLILHHEGGVYMDLDTSLNYEPNLDEKALIGYYTDKNGDIKPNNDFIYFKEKELYLEFAEWCLMRMRLCNMPVNWLARRQLHIVGSKSLVAFVRHKKIFRQFTGYKRGSEASWLKVYSKKS